MILVLSPIYKIWPYFQVLDIRCFVSVDILTLMGWGQVILVVADYWAPRMVGQYLLPGKMALTDDIVECGFLLHLVWFIDYIKVKRAEESGGWFIGGQRID